MQLSAAVTQPAQPRPITPANSTASGPPSGWLQGTNAWLKKAKADTLLGSFNAESAWTSRVRFPNDNVHIPAQCHKQSQKTLY
jgi:hypothetical protein